MNKLAITGTTLIAIIVLWRLGRPRRLWYWHYTRKRGEQ